jgi:hypothetical protein
MLHASSDIVKHAKELWQGDCAAACTLLCRVADSWEKSTQRGKDAGVDEERCEMADVEEERLVCLIAQSMLLGVPAQQVCLSHCTREIMR